MHMASISEQEATPGILMPKLSHKFKVKFRDYSLKLSGEELDRLQFQVISVDSFNAFPHSDNITITFEDDLAGMLDSILTKIKFLNIFIDIEIQLLENDNVIKKIEFGSCEVYSDMYSRLSYSSNENSSSVVNVSSMLPDYDRSLSEKSEWYQLVYQWLASIRFSNKSVHASKAFPPTINRIVSFKKI